MDMPPFKPINPARLVGKTFGSLKVLSLSKDRSSNGSRMYDCVCSCGSTLQRAGAHILFQAEQGLNQCCPTCREHLQENRHHVLRHNLRELWDTLHTLYGASYDDRELEALRAELAEADIGYAYPESTIPEGYEVTAGLDPLEVYAAPTQQMGDLYPLDGGEDREWVCVHCGVHASRVFGCVQCLEPICVQCVRDERHVCHDPQEGVTLEEIGRMEGVTRERIRQVEEVALEKLRTAFRQILKEKAKAPKSRALPIRLTKAWGDMHRWISLYEIQGATDMSDAW